MRGEVFKVLAVGQSWEIYDDFFILAVCSFVLWGREPKDGENKKFLDFLSS